MKQYDDTFSKLTNELFYVKEEIENEDKPNYSCEKSILYKTGYDDKIILILHELFLNTTLRRECLITLDYLIEKCGYKLDKDNRKSFKDTLEKLKKLEIINYKNYNKSNELITIDTENIMLNLESNFTQLSDEELNKLSPIEDIRLKVSLLKLYMYLKARTKKRTNNEDLNLNCKSQTTYQSYEIIEKYTNISQSRIKTYIDQLQDLKLITYRKVGYRYKEQDIKKIKTECPNVYAINCLQDDIESELKIGIDQCKNKQEEDGYIVTQEAYKNHDNKKIGLYGSLIKKRNNNKITDKEIKQLTRIENEMQEYKTPKTKTNTI
jgi:hypothetical protein